MKYKIVSEIECGIEICFDGPKHCSFLSMKEGADFCSLFYKKLSTIYSCNAKMPYAKRCRKCLSLFSVKGEG